APALRDPYGHGTHIAGIIGASGNPSVPGIAPGVNFVSLRVLDANGSGNASTVIRAIDWAIDHRQQLNIRVMNLSLGQGIHESFRSDPLDRAVERAWAAGIVVVIAAGNGGRQVPNNFTIESPGNDPLAITVGAMNDLNTVPREDDIITTYSSRG